MFVIDRDAIADIKALAELIDTVTRTGEAPNHRKSPVIRHLFDGEFGNKPETDLEAAALVNQAYADRLVSLRDNAPGFLQPFAQITKMFQVHVGDRRIFSSYSRSGGVPLAVIPCSLDAAYKPRVITDRSEVAFLMLSGFNAPTTVEMIDRNKLI